MNAHRPGFWLLCLVLAATVLLPAPIGRAATDTVIAEGVSFAPTTVHISLGDTVVWKYRTSPNAPNHTVTFDSGPDLNQFCPLLTSDCLNQANPTVQRTFTTTGTFHYHCKIHAGQGMTGTVVVAAATSTTTATTAPKSSTTATTKPSSTTTTTRVTSSTTTTTRPLATSSTVVRSSTTTSDTSSALVPGAPPSLSGDSNSAAGGRSGDSGGSDRGPVALIVGLLLAVSAGGGYLLWRLRPGRP